MDDFTPLHLVRCDSRGHENGLPRRQLGWHVVLLPGLLAPCKLLKSAQRLKSAQHLRLLSVARSVEQDALSSKRG